MAAQPPRSPTTPTTTQYDSSYELISAPSSSDEASVDSWVPNDTDDEDEIVWSLSSFLRSDDFVLLDKDSLQASLSAPSTPMKDNAASLSKSLSKLSLSDSDTDQGDNKETGSPASKSKFKKKRKQHRASKPKRAKSPLTNPSIQACKDQEEGFCARSIVDDISDAISTTSDMDSVVPSVYEEAVNCVTQVLSNPTQHRINNLTFLQSLIIELGLAAPSMPLSLTSARAILKSNAFVNIREYLAVRGEGLAAIQSVMHPSKNALIKDIKRRKNRTPLTWVKQNGLQVLLVSCYH